MDDLFVIQFTVGAAVAISSMMLGWVIARKPKKKKDPLE